MKIVLANAISPNGYLAREDGQEDWLPSEGWDEFLIDAKRFNNIVMGRQTYELVTKLYPNYNFDDVDTGYKVIITNNQDFSAPDGYTVVHSPEEATGFLEEQGIGEMLLIGGGKLNAEFLKRKLVSEIWMTITPYLLGKGRQFIARGDFEAKLELIETIPLSKGRVQLKYRLIK